MTETAVSQRNTVSATGFANPLNLPANAEAASHVKVYGDDVLLTNGADYTLDGVGDLGDLDAVAGVDVYIEQDTIDLDIYSSYTVEHDPPMDQGSDLSSGGLLGEIFEAALDAVMRRLQAVRAYVDRSLRAPPDLASFDNELPYPDPGKALKWNDTGTGLENSLSDPDSDAVIAVGELTDAAEAAAVAAAASAAAADASADIATAQALDASDSADRAEDAAASAGDLSALLAYLWPVGGSLMFNGRSAPTNFLKENGAAVSRATYSALWAAIHTEATVTVDTGTDLWTWTTHGLSAGDTVRFYTTGVLPTGITANTTYYVIASGLTANAFKVATTLGGSAINMSGTPSGVHTAVNAPDGYGDGTTTFNVPESRGEFFRGLDDGRGIDSGRILGSAQSEQVGPHTHTASIASGGAHTHTYSAQARRGANGETQSVFRPSNGDSTSPSTSPTLTTTSNGDHTHTITINNNSGTENRPRNKAKLMCIKY